MGPKVPALGHWVEKAIGNPPESPCLGAGIDPLGKGRGGWPSICRSVQSIIFVKCLGTPGHKMLYKCQLLLGYLAWVIDFSPGVLTWMEQFDVHSSHIYMRNSLALVASLCAMHFKTPECTYRASNQIELPHLGFSYLFSPRG